MNIDLNSAFPESATGTRGPLPKQAEFMRAVLQDPNSKYIAYVGGVGSGKTLIGCITMMTMAIMHPGDYLVARLYMPELKMTTMKTFLEICPAELIVEYRVADGIVKLKNIKGTVSTVFFRQLEEYDKLRSLNLSGFYIDEASQVSEEAFMLLQGRLRGPGLRKGFLTSNPAGHNWLYSWFVKQDLFKDESIKKQFKLIRAPSTENTHLPDGYIKSMLLTWSPERIKREIEGSFDAFEGMVYHEFRRDTHSVQPFAIPPEWTRIVGADHGYRNPSCWLWAAIDYDDNIYIYREFYEKEWDIREIVLGNKKQNKPGVLSLCKGEKIEQVRMDPSVNAVNPQTGITNWQAYLEHLPKDFPMLPANNDVAVGIDRVKQYLKLNPKTNKPRLFIFNNCYNLLEEMSKYRYKELDSSQKGRSAEKEAPMKVDDHAMDALRYLVMTRSEPPKHDTDRIKNIKDPLARSVAQHLHDIRNPRNDRDPFESE